MGIKKQASLRRVLASGQVEGFNRGMKHLLAAAALVSLVACASPAETVGPVSLGHDITCNASEQRAPNGEVSTLYISLSIPARGGVGEFCIATGCEAATYDLALTRSRTGRDGCGPKTAPITTRTSKSRAI